MRSRLLLATMMTGFSSGAAIAQVSVPLPAVPTAPAPARPAPAPVSTGQSQPGTTVPLPGGKPPPQPTTPDIESLPVVGQNGAGVPIGKYGRPDINPYDRDLEMTVPLMYKRRSLGDLPVLLTFDDRLLVDRPAFARLIGALLNPDARSRFEAATQDSQRLDSDSLKPLGIAFEYDPSSLAVVVVTIDPAARSIEPLFTAPSPGTEASELEPASFAAMLNVNAVYSHYWSGSDRSAPPTVSLNGAIRAFGVVLEGDGQFGERGFSNDSYSFHRNYLRLVYDQPDSYRRWYLGDLTPETRGQQGYVRMGGIGVLRQRQPFDPYRSSVLQGNRQLLLQRDATVRILRNGVLYRELRLDAGSYDFSSLPLLSGSNDVQIEVRDNSGTVQTVSYSQYLDPIDLVPGDYEYGAYIGPMSEVVGTSPKYDGAVAFTGFFRKAFVNAPAIGIGVQATRNVQILTGQSQFVLPGGSRLMLDGGISKSRVSGSGFALGAGYDMFFDRGGLTDSGTVRIDYLSRNYDSISSPGQINRNAMSITGQYNRQFNLKLTGYLTGNYLKSRDAPDSYRFGASASYYLDRRFSIRGGVEYSKLDTLFGRGKGVGFNIALVFQPNYRDRADARHDSTNSQTSLSYQHSSSNRIGSVGYGVTATRDDNTLFAQGYADYVGNRFDASVSQASYGADFGRFGSTNVTSVRVGTSIAFADGVVGVGRRINDSFALLYPHRNLKGHQVVAGQSLATNDYMSKSGTFGAAVNGYLTSYVMQPIQYDVENPPPGYDVGSGVVRVKPPYHSGYKLKIGTDAFASATGTLLASDGTPVSLAGGRVTATDGKDKAPLFFFTNSVGRFAIANLRPGVTYRVDLGSDGTTFEFTVPADTTGLVNLKTVNLKQAN